MFLRAGILPTSASPSQAASRSAISNIMGALGCSSVSPNTPVSILGNPLETKSLDDQCQPRDSKFSARTDASHKLSPPSSFGVTRGTNGSRSNLWKWETTIPTSYHHHVQPFIQSRRLYHHSYFYPAAEMDKQQRWSSPKVQIFLRESPQIRYFSVGRSDRQSAKDDNPGNKSPASSGNPNEGDSGTSPKPQMCVVTIKDGLETREAATDFLGQLTDHQKQLIYHTLNIEILRDKYEGHLGSSRLESHHYLSKFGRPATAKEDPTGTLCEVSPRWLHARLDEKAPPAPASAIWAVALKNALPFIGFGFLDNLIMILAGDYIDLTIGTALGISTMAAAALGNTISDVAGIGSAWYVEAFAAKLGIKDPDLTPSQMASSSVRWACNLGRAFGVTIGCLLGMFPLLFLPSAEEIKERELLKNQGKCDENEGTKKGEEAPSKFA